MFLTVLLICIGLNHHAIRLTVNLLHQEPFLNLYPNPFCFKPICSDMKKLFTLILGCIALSVSVQAQLVNVINEVAYTDDGSIAGYPAGASTYRVYALLTDGADALTAAYAESGSTLNMGTSDDAIWNTVFGGSTGDALNPAFFPSFPEAEWDSMVNDWASQYGRCWWFNYCHHRASFWNRAH